MSKQCSKCKNWYPKTTDFFSKDSKSSDKLKSQCKKCKNEYNRKYKEVYRKEHLTELISRNNLHTWVKRRKEQPQKCVMCNNDTSKLQLANISGKYFRDIRDFIWICKECHLLLDNIYLEEARAK